MLMNSAHASDARHSPDLTDKASLDQTRRIVIVGGGLAGMAAAVALVPTGAHITLLESRGRLGGRASSFLDQATGTVVDNCQHVNMGCGTNFTHFCQTTGISDALTVEKELYFIARDRKVNVFRANWGPAPFHLAGSLASLSYLTWRDKWSLGWALRALAHPRETASEEVFGDWLQRHRQSDRLQNLFWGVVLVSALSELPERVTVAAARKVFVDGFLAHRKAWEVQIPTVPLDELYTVRVKAWLEARGVVVNLNCKVTEVSEGKGVASGVRLQSGEKITAGQILLAVPSFRLADLLPTSWKSWPEVVSAQQIPWASITSLHLWTDQPISPLPHAVLLDRVSQWYFSRGIVRDSQENSTGRHLSQVVISASHAIDPGNSDAVRDTVWNELCELWQEARTAKLLESRLVTEHKAALSCQPGVEHCRPEQATRVANLFWAGDWTKTGWPSTMEGAVRSGYLAAESMCAASGETREFLQPDLPVDFWARWVFGISRSSLVKPEKHLIGRSE